MIRIGLFLLLCLSACKPPNEAVDCSGKGGEMAPASWAAVTAAIDQSPYGDLSVVIGNRDGIAYAHSKGNACLDGNMVIWSASKWVTSTALLRLVDKGQLSLSDHPQQYISFWEAGADPRRLDVTLQQLLSFTSGLKDTGSLLQQCEFSSMISYLDCARRIYKDSLLAAGKDNGGLSFAPGTTYAYGGKHMHIAGLMAIQKLAVPSYNDVFTAFQRDTGLFPAADSSFRTPSIDNPMPSGGLHTSAREYAEFLRRHLRRELLSPASYAALYQDHTRTPVAIDYSPIRDAYKESEEVSEDWHYGLGLWIECAGGIWKDVCAQADQAIYSSPGAKGFYPFIDYGRGYFGIVATDQHNPAQTAIKLVRPLLPMIQALVAQR